MEDTYILLIRAYDMGTPSLFGETSVIISLNDVNDITPLFSKSSYNASVLENAVAGENLLMLTKCVFL